MTHLFGVQIPTTPWLVVASIISVIVVCACQVREFMNCERESSSGCKERG